MASLRPREQRLSTHSRLTVRDRSLHLLQALSALWRRDGRSVLPPVRVLAEAAGVSRQSISRALAALRRQGAVSTTGGGGTRVAGMEPHHTPHAGGSRWKPQAVANAVYRDVMAGTYLRGERLPGLKSMMATYGASYRTLKRALSALAADGVVTPHRRGYLAAPLPARRAGSTIALTTGALDRRRPWWEGTPWWTSLMHALEMECVRMGVSLLHVPLRHTGAAMVPVPPYDNAGAWLGNVLGFMLWTSGVRREYSPQLIAALQRYGKPIGVLDERGGIGEPVGPLRPARDRCIVIANREEDGVDVGRFLQGLGHRRVLYVGPTDVGRYRGLCRAYAMAGEPQSVARVPDRDLADPAFPAARVNDALARLIGDLGQRRRAAEEYALLGAAIQAAAESVASLALDEHLYGSLAPRLLRTLSAHGATAVIAFNDHVARLCARCCREHGLAVPHDISVVGFDDSPQASAADLTSYNFNGEGAVRILLSHLVAGDRPGRVEHSATETIEGFLTVRGSTGPARQG